MRSQPNPAVWNAVINIPRMDIPQSGILLFDMELNPVALDSGAAGILNPSGNSRDPISIPEDVLQAIRSRRAADRTPVQSWIFIGRNKYSYKTYIVRSENPALPSRLIAVHLEADTNGIDPVARLALRHHLTEREIEALRGIALGLSTKELADRMEISPNTVKAFVRLIMIKLGVTTRTAIVVKLLDRNGAE